MSKDKKDMLKTILANTQAIMKHLNISAAPKESAKAAVKKPAAKKAVAKKTTAKK
jgi:hypothetical protein